MWLGGTSLLLCLMWMTPIWECDAELVEDEQLTPGNVSETELARQLWKDQEDHVKATLESFFRTLFPSLVRLGSEAEISSECQAAYFKMFVAVRQLKTWALQSERLLFLSSGVYGYIVMHSRMKTLFFVVINSVLLTS